MQSFKKKCEWQIQRGMTTVAQLLTQCSFCCFHLDYDVRPDFYIWPDCDFFLPSEVLIATIVRLNEISQNKCEWQIQIQRGMTNITVLWHVCTCRHCSPRCWRPLPRPARCLGWGCRLPTVANVANGCPLSRMRRQAANEVATRWSSPLSFNHEHIEDGVWYVYGWTWWCLVFHRVSKS